MTKHPYHIDETARKPELFRLFRGRWLHCRTPPSAGLTLHFSNTAERASHLARGQGIYAYVLAIRVPMASHRPDSRPPGGRAYSLGPRDELDDSDEGIESGSARGLRGGTHFGSPHAIEPVPTLHEELRIARNEIAELKGMVSSVLEMTSGLALKLNGEYPSKSGDHERASVVTQVGAVDDVFKLEFVRSIACATIPHFVTKECKGRNLECKGMNFSEAPDNNRPLWIISVLFFSTHSTEKKTAKKLTTSGKAHSELRKRIVKVLTRELPSQKVKIEQYFAAQAAASRTSGHARPPTSRTSVFSSQSEDGSTTPSAWVAPVWMAEGYLTTDMIESVRSIVDGLQPAALADGGETRGKKRKKPESESVKDEIAREVLKLVFGKVSDLFNRARDAARKAFVQQLGYILQEHANGRKSRVSWTSQDAVVLKYIEQVPQLEPFQGCVTPEKTELNRRAYKELVATRPEMAFKVTYHVTVQPDPEDVLGEEEVRPVTTSISLLDCALNVYAAFVRCSDADELFRSTPDALRIVYVIALGFRSIVQTYQEDYCDLNHANRPAWADVQVHWDILLPGKAVMEKILQEGILRMKQSDYETITDQEAIASSIPSRSSGNDESGRAIEADDEDDDLDDIVVRI